MITLALPVGSSHGWGVCGKYVSREMAKLVPGQVRLMTNPFTVNDFGDELEFSEIQSLQMRQEDLVGSQNVNGITHLPGPLLCCIIDKKMMSASPQIRGARTVGYTFFEENILQPAWIESARKNYDLVATGSSWCSDVLKGCGLTNVHTVIQGIDPRIFFPWTSPEPEREFLKDRFVIFSGGKFELRKGQDVVIRAVKVMQERHRDIVLVNAWFNPWQSSIDTMRGSPLLRWPAQGVSGAAYLESMTRLLAENGLDLQRVITLGPRPNALMPRVYRNSDVGIFPNRCEGGTNLVLMEYMACGKPVVANAATGHSDVVRSDNALVIGVKGEHTIMDGNAPAARWPEPDLDDAIANLEWAYQHRDAARDLGRKAGTDMARLTWRESAAHFLKLLT